VGLSLAERKRFYGQADYRRQRQADHTRLINGHTHVPMVLMRGLIDDVTLDDWLRKYIFPAEARNVTEDYVRWARAWLWRR